jgi:hypothetical protein
VGDSRHRSSEKSRHLSSEVWRLTPGPEDFSRIVANSLIANIEECRAQITTLAKASPLVK